MLLNSLQKIIDVRKMLTHHLELTSLDGILAIDMESEVLFHFEKEQFQI